MPRRLFQVEVTHKIFVTAFDAKEAARWAEMNVTEWSSDPPEDVHAVAIGTFEGEALPEDTRKSLPWAASGLSDEESDKPVQWWVDRVKKEQEP